MHSLTTSNICMCVCVCSYICIFLFYITLTQSNSFTRSPVPTFMSLFYDIVSTCPRVWNYPPEPGDITNMYTTENNYSCPSSITINNQFIEGELGVHKTFLYLRLIIERINLVQSKCRKLQLLWGHESNGSMMPKISLSHPSFYCWTLKNFLSPLCTTPQP